MTLQQVVGDHVQHRALEGRLRAKALRMEVWRCRSKIGRCSEGASRYNEGGHGGVEVQQKAWRCSEV
eukprot:1160804-Pelagomonas_calceolata.AAC.19